MAVRVLVAHDYLTQRGGAERVALTILESFPGARLITGMYAPDATFPEFRNYDIDTLWLDRVPALRADPRKALPLLAPAWSSYKVRDADVVVASSSGWAHAVGGSSVPKIVYCHNPARWLYQRADYSAGMGLSGTAVLSLLGPPLRRWDRQAAASATLYLANSSAVQRRVRAVYGRDATLLHPPATLDPEDEQVPIPGLEPGYLLTVARNRGYKNTAVVCQAVAGMLNVRLVVVGGLPDGSWPDNLLGLKDVTDAQLRWLYGNAAGLVGVSHEDFGLTPVEGYTFGVPSVLLRAGGYVDSSIESVTTIFVDRVSVRYLQDAIMALLTTSWNRDDIREHATHFSRIHFQDRLRQIVRDVAAA